MNRTMQRLGWGLGVTAVAFAGAALAADEPAGSATEQQQIQPQAGQQRPGAIGQRHAGQADQKQEVIVRRLSDFSPADVRSPADENLGRIQDVVVDTQSGRVVYAILSFGGFLGVGDKNFAVPFAALKPKISQEDTEEVSYVLNVDKNRLQQAKGFDRDKWPNMADRSWARETHQFWNVQPYWEQGREAGVAARDRERPRIEGEPISPEQRGQQMKTDLLLKGEDLVGHKVLDQKGQEFAELEEVMADPHTGRLIYGIVQIDKAPDFAKDYMYPVPFKALEVRPARQARQGEQGQQVQDRAESQLIQDEEGFEVVLNVPRDKLQKGPKFGEREWPSMTMQWGEQVYNYYGMQPSWKEEGQQRHLQPGQQGRIAQPDQERSRIGQQPNEGQ